MGARAARLSGRALAAAVLAVLAALLLLLGLRCLGTTALGRLKEASRSSRAGWSLRLAGGTQGWSRDGMEWAWPSFRLEWSQVEMLAIWALDRVFDVGLSLISSRSAHTDL